MLIVNDYVIIDDNRSGDNLATLYGVDGDGGSDILFHCDCFLLDVDEFAILDVEAMLALAQTVAEEVELCGCDLIC